MTIPQPSTIALHNLGNFMKFIFGSVKKAAKNDQTFGPHISIKQTSPFPSKLSADFLFENEIIAPMFIVY